MPSSPVSWWWAEFDSTPGGRAIFKMKPQLYDMNHNFDILKVLCFWRAKQTDEFGSWWLPNYYLLNPRCSPKSWINSRILKFQIWNLKKLIFSDLDFVCVFEKVIICLLAFGSLLNHVAVITRLQLARTPPPNSDPERGVASEKDSLGN